MPSPAPFPSVLSVSGSSIVDANGYVVSPMKGINVNPTAIGFAQAPTLADFRAIAAKGAKYVRAEIRWASLNPSNGTISAAYVAELDAMVANCVTAGLYVWFNFIFNGSSNVMPAWAQVTAPQGSLQNYVASGQQATQYLASRYGNSSTGAKYTAAVIGMSINEPVADFTNANNWVTNHATEQLQMVTWMRAAGNAPQWIASLSAGPSSGTALVPNATGSGQAAQTFTGAPTNWSTNWMVEVHDPMKVTTTNTGFANFPNTDGRNVTYGGLGGTNVQIDNATYPGYVSPGGATCVPGITRAQMQAMWVAWWANYTQFATSAGVPLWMGEGNWDPVLNNTGPGGGDGIQYLADKLALWGSLSPALVMMSFWEYHIDQSADDFAMRPGTGAAIVGGALNGWTVYANNFLAGTAGAFGGAGPGSSLICVLEAAGVI